MMSFASSDPVQRLLELSDPTSKSRSSANSASQLKKCDASPTKYKEFKPPKDWANAPEFVPKNFKFPQSESVSQSSRLEQAPVSQTFKEMSPAYTINDEASSESSVVANPGTSRTYDQRNLLCPYAMLGECRYGEQCKLIHGKQCEYCEQSCLHPYDAEQRESHQRECIRHHEREMELAFAVAQSTGKTCGICMEVVLDKSPAGEQRFGILPSCNHCFCLSCIRRWRQARQFENKIIRACPECRITSDFVCPSRFWVETKPEKDKLIGNYKVALSKKACRYYRTGAGTCPFGNKCFYLHALPDGTKVDVGPPRRKPRRQNDSGADSGDSQVSIWEFLEEWEVQWMDIEDFMEMMDSDESEWSEPDFQDVESDSEVELMINNIRESWQCPPSSSNLLQEFSDEDQ